MRLHQPSYAINLGQAMPIDRSWLVAQRPVAFVRVLLEMCMLVCMWIRALDRQTTILPPLEGGLVGRTLDDHMHISSACLYARAAEQWLGFAKFAKFAYSSRRPLLDRRRLAGAFRVATISRAESLTQLRRFEAAH